MNRRPFGYRFRTYGIIAALSLVSAPLIYAFFHQISQSAFQAEAKLMISYLHTLERVYRQENGGYAFFSWYGAPQTGADHCPQPEGAAALGFFIHGCHQERSMPPRYTYRILDVEAPAEIKPLPPAGELPYRIEARSGSDAQQRSLVCFTPEEVELWVSSSNKRLEPVLPCW